MEIFVQYIQNDSVGLGGGGFFNFNKSSTATVKTLLINLKYQSTRTKQLFLYILVV